MQEQIAKITRTELGREDHGIFTAMIQVDYGNSGQGVGGYALDEPIHVDGKFVRRSGSSFGMEWVIRFMDAVGARTWEEVKGKTILVYSEDERVVGVGPLPTERGKKFMYSELSHND